MGFKDIVREDIQKIFIVPEEFGAVHQINDRRIPIVIDDNEMIEREKRTPMMDGAEGIYKRQLLFYVAASEFGPLPAVGRTLTLDGRPYQITDAINEDGIYSISLKAVRAT